MALTLFVGINLLLRIVVLPGLHCDEADLLVFDQYWAWGYSEQPPLYTWLQRGFTLVLGPNLWALTFLRAILQAATAIFVYLSLRSSMRDVRAATVGASSLLLVPVLAWDVLNYLTHSLLMAALCAATLYVVIRLVREGQRRDYVALGVACGLGVLSKYSFVFFVVGLVLAGATSAPVRGRLLDRRILLSLAVAGLIVLPHGLWVLAHQEEFLHAYRVKAAAGHAERLWGFIPSGLIQLARHAILLALPLAPLVIFLHPRLLSRSGPSSFHAAWAVRMAVALGGLFALYVIVTDGRVHQRWLEPFFVLLPVCLFWRLKDAPIPEGRWRLLTQCVIVAAVGMTVARFGQLYTGFSLRGYNSIDYSFVQPAQDILPSAARGTVVVSMKCDLAGNLRPFHPEASFLSTERAALLPRDTHLAQRYVLVWHTDVHAVPAPLCEFARERLGVDIDEATIQRVNATSPTRDEPLQLAFVCLEHARLKPRRD